jgi:glycosyltransferase involved in cell wall biosynthesis
LKNKKVTKNYFYEAENGFNKENINVTVIIPVYNSEKTINYSISSIQQQNLTNLEIILVNDFSIDNSINIILSFQKNDSRIKLINNKQNYGTLYSRSIGALSSKGAYIFSLDNDDKFFGEDSLDYIYKQAKEGNYDIINFKRIYAKNNKQLKIRLQNINFSNYKFSEVYQPDLSIYPISRKGRFFQNSFFVWDKCIKTIIYQKAVNILGNDIYSHKISYNEDIIIVFIICSLSKSMKIINKYAIIHYIFKYSTARTINQDYKLYCDIYFLDILFRFSKNNYSKNLCVEYFLGNKRFKNKLITKNHLDYLIKVLNKIITDKYITEKNKSLLKLFMNRNKIINQ